MINVIVVLLIIVMVVVMMVMVSDDISTAVGVYACESIKGCGCYDVISTLFSELIIYTIELVNLKRVQLHRIF